MTASTRRQTIEKKLRAEGEVGYSALAAEFGVSEMTIRRDIEALEAAGVSRRIRGGAIALDNSRGEPSFVLRETRALEAKSRIGEVAASLIRPGQIVIIDSGSSALAVARAIRGRDLGLTIITPSLLVASTLHDEPGTSILVTGGELRPGELSLIGPSAEASFKLFNADLFIMGVAGVDARHGMSDYHYGEAHVKKAAMAAAQRSIVVADSQKLGKVLLVSIAEFADVDVIVTDAPMDHPSLLVAERAGTRVVSVADSTSEDDLQGEDRADRTAEIVQFERG